MTYLAKVVDYFGTERGIQVYVLDVYEEGVHETPVRTYALCPNIKADERIMRGTWVYAVNTKGEWSFL